MSKRIQSSEQAVHMTPTTKGQTNMTIIVTRQSRQGDVLIHRIDREPAATTEIPREDGRVVLAHGEVTGHAHAFRDPGVCSLRAEGVHYDILRVAEGIVAELAHEEHTHHQVSGGTYEIRIQQEWDYLSEMARQVQD